MFSSVVNDIRGWRSFAAPMGKPSLLKLKRKILAIRKFVGKRS